MRPVAWEGYGYLDRRGLLRVLLHGLSAPPLEITISGVAPRKPGATVFLVRVRRERPPDVKAAVRAVIARGMVGRRTK
jgi:hypothetical protein